MSHGKTNWDGSLDLTNLDPRAYFASAPQAKWVGSVQRFNYLDYQQCSGFRLSNMIRHPISRVQSAAKCYRNELILHRLDQSKPWLVENIDFARRTHHDLLHTIGSGGISPDTDDLNAFLLSCHNLFHYVAEIQVCRRQDIPLLLFEDYTATQAALARSIHSVLGESVDISLPQFDDKAHSSGGRMAFSHSEIWEKWCDWQRWLFLTIFQANNGTETFKSIYPQSFLPSNP
ncbi:MAG: hypothetical protein KDC71_14715 [Acidobacteria bacterium]|nr:hypothetical protein [Acidobacteriota bacterium]